MSAIAQQLANIIDSDSICPWDQLDPSLHSAISSALRPNASAGYLVYPNTQEELAEVMACAHRNRWRVLPCGSGSKLSWGGLVEDVQIVISTARLQRLVDHAVGDLTVTAEAGLPLAQLQQTLGQARQVLALDPAYADRATLGGIVATADAGPWRQRYGGVRDMLIGISFVRHDGQLAKAGGRVVKNVAGYDLMKLLTGSYGSLGIISQLTWRIYPLPETTQSIVLTGASEPIRQAARTVLASALTPTRADLLSAATMAALALHDTPEEGPGLMLQFQGLAVGVAQQIAQVKQVGQALGLTLRLVAESDDANLWQSLQDHMEAIAPSPAITCKIGVLPSLAVSALEQMTAMTPALVGGAIHAGSGLGWLRLAADSVRTPVLQKLRQLCQSQGGFLTLLTAPPAFKQQMDVWGYGSNALPVMQGIKQQFDPDRRLSPSRFLGR